MPQEHPFHLLERDDAEQDGGKRDGCPQAEVENRHDKSRKIEGIEGRKQHGDGAGDGSRDRDGLALLLRSRRGAVRRPIPRLDLFLTPLKGSCERPPPRHFLRGVVHVVRLIRALFVTVADERALLSISV